MKLKTKEEKTLIINKLTFVSISQRPCNLILSHTNGILK